jgi:hypothetical protein
MSARYIYTLLAGTDNSKEDSFGASGKATKYLSSEMILTGIFPATVETDSKFFFFFFEE